MAPLEKFTRRISGPSKINPDYFVDNKGQNDNNNEPHYGLEQQQVILGLDYLGRSVRILGRRFFVLVLFFPFLTFYSDFPDKGLFFAQNPFFRLFPGGEAGAFQGAGLYLLSTFSGYRVKPQCLGGYYRSTPDVVSAEGFLLTNPYFPAPGKVRPAMIHPFSPTGDRPQYLSVSRFFYVIMIV